MYKNSISSFLEANPQTILGGIINSQNGDVTTTQRNAWQQQIEILQNSLIDIEGTICFEFSIPRVGKRIDNVLLIGNKVIVIEFKVCAVSYDRADILQVDDYSLDLMNFHEGSHGLSIIPVLVATEAPDYSNKPEIQRDNLCSVLRANRKTLSAIIHTCTSSS
jgi:hypothetical protein